MAADNITAKIVEIAQENDEFRAALLADARAAIKQQFNIEIPASLQLRVIEETGDEVVLVLPARTSGDEVSDAELAGVAGGWSLTPTTEESLAGDPCCGGSHCDTGSTL